MLQFLLLLGSPICDRSEISSLQYLKKGRLRISTGCCALSTGKVEALKFAIMAWLMAFSISRLYFK